MTSKKITDQLGREFSLSTSPRRIISLVPSLTELIAEGLGLASSLVGITDYCVHPAVVAQSVTAVGGPKSINIATVKAMQPDLVVASREENIREQIAELSTFVPVFVTDVVSIAGACETIAQLGEVLAVPTRALALVEDIREGFRSYVKPNPAVRAVYLIWKDPYMAVGAGTFIDDMLNASGFCNVAAETFARYQQVEIAQLAAMNPDVVLLSSEPYTFTGQDREELKSQLPTSAILHVDGEIFSWYGNRMLKAPAYFKQLLKFVM